jgi:hypothetical protein
MHTRAARLRLGAKATNNQLFSPAVAVPRQPGVSAFRQCELLPAGWQCAAQLAHSVTVYE